MLSEERNELWRQAGDLQTTLSNH